MLLCQSLILCITAYFIVFIFHHLMCFGQDTQLLLWDLEMDEIVVPLRRPPGGSPTYSTGSQSAHWDSACPVGNLQPAPSTRDVPKISPVVAHRVHTEPLSGLIFTQESVLTVCREGHIKIWMRPGVGESQSNNSETLSSTSFKEKPLFSSKVGSSSYKLWAYGQTIMRKNQAIFHMPLSFHLVGFVLCIRNVIGVRITNRIYCIFNV